MILTRLDCVACRVHDPKWSYAPASGDGAGRHGGRANRPGVNALYLSLELETALTEYGQLDALMPPGLMVSYQLSIGKAVDFRGGWTKEWDPLWQDFYCDWRSLPTQRAAEKSTLLEMNFAHRSNASEEFLPFLRHDL